MKLISKITILSLLLSSNISKAQITLKNVYQNNYSAFIGTSQGINYREGGFSGLCYIPGTQGIEFYTLTDRGLNIDAKNASCIPTYDKIFPFPSYNPKIFKVKIQGDSIQILNTITLKRPNGTGVTGLLNLTGAGSTSVETVWTGIPTVCGDVSSVLANKDAWGIDSEGIAIGKNNDFWICEEGGPTIWNVDANGKVIKRYTPYANLPGADPLDVAIDTVFKYRKNNRGFEGVAITPNGKVYAIIQSAILYPNKTDGEKSNVHRILELNPANGTSKMYAYLNPGDLTLGADVIKAKDWKIGDLTAVNDSTFLVIEQAVVGANIQRNIYSLNINRATPITSALYGGKTVEQLKDLTGLTAQGIVPVQKTLFMNLRTNAWPDALDKCEGITIINDSTIALTNDNDFGQSSPTENGIAQATNTKCSIYVYALKGSNKIVNFSAPTQSITEIENPNVLENSERIKLIPNPVKESAFLLLNSNKKHKVDLYSMGGTLLSSTNCLGSTNLDFSNLHKGFYTLRATCEGTSQVLKFIKE